MKMSKRNKGSLDDMIDAFKDKIDELEGTDIESSTSINATIYDEDNDEDSVDMTNEEEVRDAVALYLSTLNIDPRKFEDVVDNYVDLIMDDRYDSIEDWWNEFVDFNEVENLRSMGYILDEIDECDNSLDDEYGIVTI